MSTPKKFAALCTSLGVAPANQGRLEVGGIEVSFWANIGSKGALLGAIFSVALHDDPVLPAPLLLRRERGLDRFGKATRINRELQTGDPAFDRAVYIESDLPDDAILAVLRSDATREAIVRTLAILDANLTLYPESFDGHCTVQLSVDAGKLDDVPAIRAALVPFVALPGAVARSAREHVGPSRHDPYGRERAPVVDFGAARKPRYARGGVFAMVLVAMVVVWVSGTSPATLDGGAMVAGLALGVLGWAVVLALLIVAFRGRSTSLRTVILFGCGYMVLVPCCASFVPRLNALADGGAGASHDTVATKEVGAKNTSWLAVSVAWRAGTPLATVPLAYARGPIPRGQFAARVTTRPGAFGWEWISDVAAR